MIKFGISNLTCQSLLSNLTRSNFMQTDLAVPYSRYPNLSAQIASNLPPLYLVLAKILQI
ncbi:hypothetical protein CAMSH0001_2079 [Campylobacter showae RM3277]|uniref:Uncharacterized protein n=1 Tax=Campylobacter showae RM3277 TaxID=553219 RepID=C6REI7_9BACT|nr:hypothetical protein CAMSH0001_2079 [Campylobacter showae RM3277]